MTPRRDLALSCALALASLLAVLGAAELVLRASGYTPRRFASVARVANGRRTLLLDCFPDNPRGYFEIDLRSPGVAERYARQGVQRLGRVVARAPWAVEFRYNSLGFRERELVPRSPASLRLVVFGDSFTEGEGVKEPDILTRQLEARLAKAQPGLWDVHNAGRRGLDFPELREAFDRALLLEPNIVVYAMVLNDAERSPAFHARESFLNEWIVERSRLLRRIPPHAGPFEPRLPAFVDERIEAWRVGQATIRFQRELYGAPNAAGWQRTQAHILDMQRAAHARGARFLLMLWPRLEGMGAGYPFDGAHATIAEFCRQAAVPFFDLRAALAGHSDAELIVHPLDRHPNELAHRLAAEALLPVVRDLAATGAGP